MGVVLYFSTFGVTGIYLVLYVIAILSGGFAIAYYHGYNQSSSILTAVPDLAQSFPGIDKVVKSMEGTTKIKNFDRRITGSSVIDENLQEVLEYTARDYIKNWYRGISDDDKFLLEIRQCVQKVFISFSSRSKEIDWMPYFTQRLVDDFASHIRLYRRAMEKAKAVSNKEDRAPVLEQQFFDFEIKMEGDICRDLVSMSPPDERQYLQDLSEVLLFLLLPLEDFQNKPFRYIIREVLVNGVFIPTIDLLSDPDYINSYVLWLCKEGSFTNEMFMTVIKTTDSVEELASVVDIVDCDIARWRSQDTGGSDDTLIKQNLNSLLFVKTICEERIKRLQQGIDDNEYAPDVPDYCRDQSLFILTFDDIINNNIALSVFIEFMTTIGGQQILFFYLNVEGFRAAADLQIEARKKQDTNSSTDLEGLRKAAMIIYNQYLAEKASSRIKIENDILKRCIAKIKSKSMSADVFDEVQARVYQILHGEQYYEAFIQSKVYAKLLEELGFTSDKNADGDSFSQDDNISTRSAESMDDALTDSAEENGLSSCNNSSRSSSPLVITSSDFTISAQISQTGIVRESEKTGKSYAVFSVRVWKRSGDDEEIWDVYRRYSDFHDLQMIMAEKMPEFHGPSLPPKTVLKNTSEEFLEKRRKALNNYLQTLLNRDLWEQYPGLRDYVLKFLAPGMWEKHKSDLARKMDTVVNPLKTSVKTVGHAVKHFPDGLRSLSHEGISRLRGDSESSQDGTDPRLKGTKVGAGLDLEIGENIPLRIMLLLMDEVFDLRHKNQWLRRQIIKVLKQLLKATLGDRINKKIVDHVDWMTSSEQMAEYIKAFRDSFWPEGTLAEPRPPRDDNTKMRTRVVCKTKMLGSTPDELRHILGTDTVKIGAGRIFDMFQYRSLNRRLVYVCLEGVIETLFPQNKFKEVFRKLHSQSSRLKVVHNEKFAKETRLNKRS